MPRGKYEKWLRPENLALLRGWKADGLTNEQIAKNVDVNPDTLYEWIKRYPLVAEALSCGREHSDYIVRNELFLSAQNRVIKLRTPIKVRRAVFENGRKVSENEEVVYCEKEEYVPANVNAQMFWLRNRRPELWADGRNTGNRIAEPDAESAYSVGDLIDALKDRRICGESDADDIQR